MLNNLLKISAVGQYTFANTIVFVLVKGGISREERR